MSKLGHTLAALSLIVSMFFLAGIAVATNANFVVQPQKEHVITLTLQETDSVSGSFSVISNDDTGINFKVTDPQNATILQHGNLKQKSFSFTAQLTGNYELCFDNYVSSAYSKTVALDYNVTHYIMGMPQEQFLYIIIAIVAVIGLIAYAVLMPKS